MAQQEPIRVVVEKKGGCFSGCGTAFGVLLLIGIAVRFWYISVGLIVFAVAAAVIHNSQEKEKARRRPGQRDPWLNEVVVALAELGLTEVARNTGVHLGGVPMEGDVGLEAGRFNVYVNLFADSERAGQAEVGLRAQPNIRNAVSSGQTALKTLGPVLYVANGRGSVVDEFRLEEVIHTVGAIPLPLALSPVSASPVRAVPAAPRTPQASARHPSAEPEPDALEQIGKLAELRDAGVLTDTEFEAKKAELLRRI